MNSKYDMGNFGIPVMKCKASLTMYFCLLRVPEKKCINGVYGVGRANTPHRYTRPTKRSLIVKKSAISLNQNHA